MKKIFVLLLFFPLTSFAFVPFGGPILSVRICCNGLMLTIDRYYRHWPGGPPTLHEVETYLFEFGYSRLIVGSLSSGKQSLGLAIPGGICFIGLLPIPLLCPEMIPTTYTIYFIGTSIPIDKIVK